MRSIFITGTGTGVGKTFVGGAICAYLSLKRGLDVGVMKPCETGWDPQSSDGATLKELSGSKDQLEEIVPYRFFLPACPEVAAKHERKEVDIKRLNSIYEKLLIGHEILVVEGAGGLLVPIRDGFFFSDLIKAWRIPVLVISENRLGTINHTLLTCYYLLSLGVSVLGVVLNNLRTEMDPSSESNAEMLKKYLPTPFLGVFPYVSLSELRTSLREELADLVEEHLDLTFLPS